MENNERIYIAILSTFRGELCFYGKHYDEVEPDNYYTYAVKGYFTYTQRSLRLKLI